MRYLSLLAAILASTPVCAAEFTNRLEISPGFTARWQAPRPFTDVLIGNPDIVDATVQPNQTLMIHKNPKGGETNIVLLDEHGEQVANVLVTDSPDPTPTIQHQAVRSAEYPGEWQIYRKEDECYRICVTIDPASMPSIVVSDAPKQIARPSPGGSARNVVIPPNKLKTSHTP
jgi:hypothetical protein